jgi:hypothetical protein
MYLVSFLDSIQTEAIVDSIIPNTAIKRKESGKQKIIFQIFYLRLKQRWTLF